MIFSTLIPPFTSTFDYESAHTHFDELSQFRALQRALLKTGACQEVAELHGATSFVTFTSNAFSPPSPGRAEAVCELCDLCLISFRTKPDRFARITFLQAKLSKKTHDPCRGGFSSILERYKGDSRQWDLLKRRPNITGLHKTFRPPEDLLSGALLAAVGSFGTFYKSGKAVEFFFSAADAIDPPRPTTKPSKATLQLNAASNVRGSGSTKECVWACCPPTFAENLVEGIIGTPIHDEAGLPSFETDYRMRVRRWITSFVSNTDAADQPAINSFRRAFLQDEPSHDGPSDLPGPVLFFNLNSDFSG